MPLALKPVIAEVLEIDPGDLSEISGMNDTENWDSLRHFLILTAVEQAFAVKLPFTLFERASNIADIRKVLHLLGIVTADWEGGVY